jgi:hypothetical protein
MENIQNNTNVNAIAQQAINALEASPHLRASFAEEIEDYLFGKILQETETGKYMSKEEFKKLIEE